MLKKRTNKKNVLSYIAEQKKKRDFSDLDKLIKSDYKISKDMWIHFFDAGNVIFPNPITQFMSLGLHIDKMVSGDTFQERKEDGVRLNLI